MQTLFIFMAAFVLINSSNNQNINKLGSLSNCKLPDKCEAQPYHVDDALSKGEYYSTYTEDGIRCYLSDKHSFYVEDWEKAKNCSEKLFKSSYIELKALNRGKKTMLNKKFNMKDFIEYLYLKNYGFNLRLTNLAGIGLDLLRSNETRHSVFKELDLIRTRFNFYIGTKMIESCADMLQNTNFNDFVSILQISPELAYDYFTLTKCDLRKPVCPLVFRNANIYYMYLYGMSNSFFKKNYLRFTNETTEFHDHINSRVYAVDFTMNYNLILDLNTLNPFVFKEITSIVTYGSVSKIDSAIFRNFKYLGLFGIDGRFAKEFIHNQGSEWIQALNTAANIHVNMSDIDHIKNNIWDIFVLKIRFVDYNRIFDIFPNEDFCLYKDFPFNQFVLLTKEFGCCGANVPYNYIMEFTCTFMWLSQYYPVLLNFTKDRGWNKYLEYVVKSNAYRPQCNFDSIRRLCDKTHFKFNHIWSSIDSNVINLQFNLSIYVLKYLISLFGIVTNSIVISVIRSKKNAENFKNLNQYLYLCWNSAFSIAILAIQLFSWIDECFDFLCLVDIHESIIGQFFKVIFKETLVTTLRFLCNFAYLGFSLCRISLIGKEHGNLVEFVSKCKVWRFIAVTGLISIGLSIVKAFKYRINYDRADLSYPTPSEADLNDNHTWQAEVYLIFSIISDLFNYLVFVFVNIGVDVFMVVKLRKTLLEKMGNSNSKTLSKQINQIRENKKDGNQSQNKKTKQEDPMKAIKMVVINNVISIVVKFPLIIKPLFYLITQIYFSYPNFHNRHFGFHLFSNFVNTHYILYITHTLAEMFFLILLGVQLFIYLRFDNKFKLGFDNLKESKTANNKPLKTNL